MATGFQKDWNDFVNWFRNLFSGDSPYTKYNDQGLITGVKDGNEYLADQFLPSSVTGSSGSSGSSALGNVIGQLNGSAQTQEQYNYNLALQQQAQQFNSAEAEKQRQWEERMSNTAYQRGMEDMRAAGLNPWLMVQGSSASTASGSSASSSAGSVSQRDNGAKILGELVGSAVSIALIARIVKLITTKH